MRLLSGIATALIVAAVVVAGADARPAPLTSVRVTACQLSSSRAERSATFAATMNAVPGTARMALRFRLRQRGPRRRIAPVHSRPLAAWRRSRPGVQTFTYSQTVNGLARGIVYWMAIDYRWFDTSGHVTRKATRYSAACNEAGSLNNLKISDVSAHKGPDPRTVLYDFDVENTGHLAERNIKLHLYVDTASAGETTLDSLDPGTTRAVELSGPPCTRGLQLAIERATETRRTVLDWGCPAVQ